MDDNSRLQTVIEDEGLTARLIAPPRVDRSQLTKALCESTLRGDNIELTPKVKENIEKFIAKVEKAPIGEVQTIIAKGTPPTDGEDGRLEWALDELKKNNPKPEAGKDQGAVSFYEQSHYTIVKSGQVLGTLHPPTSGEDGRDVTGQTLPATEGRPAEFNHDESILIGKGHKIIANADGVLDCSKGMAAIHDTIDVHDNIDFNTGNICFDGNVIVRKGVRDCFKIETGGDVEVRGLIEAATIVAGRNLHAKGGFAGREQGVAEVAGDLYARYLDAVTVRVEGDLCVDREVLNCNTTVRGRVASPRSSIIGGQTLVAGGVVVAELGSNGLPQTTVEVGVLPHLDPPIKQLSGLVRQLTEQRQKLLDEKEMIEQASGGTVAPANKERVCELLCEIAEVQKYLDRAEPSLAQARERAEELREVDVYVDKQVHPNTELVCSGMRYRVQEALRGPLRITMDRRGRLNVEREGQRPVPLAQQADLTSAA